MAIQSVRRYERCIPGLKLSEIFCGYIWTTSYWVDPDCLELRGLLFRRVLLLFGFSMKGASHPLLSKFWLKSHREVKVLACPKS